MRIQTQAGERFLQAAQALIPILRAHAQGADRQANVDRESIDALKAAGIQAAFVPEELGGMGLTSVHDWMAGIAILGRGDGSIAIGINMHLGVSRGLAAAYRLASSAGHDASGLRQSLEAIASGEMLVCATATEAGTDNLHPLTEATPDGDGWVINGSKMFVTLSPIATHLGMNLRQRGEHGDQIVTTLLPIDTPGVIPNDDWDALGMRGSGSQSIRFENVSVPGSALRPIGPWGRWSTSMLMNRTLGNLPLIAAFLGIAEHAHELTLKALDTQRRLDQPVKFNSGVQHTVGEMEIELAACRSILYQTGQAVDDLLDGLAGEQPEMKAAYNLMKDYQSAKWIVNSGAINIVSRAMDLVGGGAFMSGNTLSRLYRDVRAGPFMQPLSRTEARQYVGQVALGVYPEA